MGKIDDTLALLNLVSCLPLRTACGSALPGASEALGSAPSQPVPPAEKIGVGSTGRRGGQPAWGALPTPSSLLTPAPAQACMMTITFLPYTVSTGRFQASLSPPLVVQPALPGERTRDQDAPSSGPQPSGGCRQGGEEAGGRQACCLGGGTWVCRRVKEGCPRGPSSLQGRDVPGPPSPMGGAPSPLTGSPSPRPVCGSPPAHLSLCT